MLEENFSFFDKKRLLKNFNAAAVNYDSAAVLQKYTGGELLDRLNLVRLAPKTILDLGSGPGEMSRALSSRYKKSRVVQIDFAESMLRQSMAGENKDTKRYSYLCADAEALPIKKGAVDLVYSNLMLQWCPNLAKLFADVFYSLRPGGLFIFSSLGPDTLFELRDSWAAVDEEPHVNMFQDMHVLGDAMVGAGFAEPVIEVDNVVITYSSVSELMADLKTLGARNASSQRRKSLTGKERLRRVYEEYEKWREDGKLPSTYEVIYGHAWTPGTTAGKEKREFSISLDTLKAALKRHTNK
ncbi:MAG: malonyl-CoA O-methyltransferase [Gammaproteobacteria bacterium]|jgi:malonyl-CoA O-methyltransferase